MGSILSGRYGRRTNRRTTDDYLSFDVRYLARKALLKPGSVFTLTWTKRGKTVDSLAATAEAGRLIVANSYGGYPVRLEWTRCRLGGRRAWFRCPQCGRRCCLLYRAWGYACRECLRLAYPVEREGRLARAERRAWKIIGRGKSESSRKYGKPKWQRWPTFWRLFNEAEAAVDHVDVRQDRIMAMVRAVDERLKRQQQRY